MNQPAKAVKTVNPWTRSALPIVGSVVGSVVGCVVVAPIACYHGGDPEGSATAGETTTTGSTTSPTTSPSPTSASASGPSPGTTSSTSTSSSTSWSTSTASSTTDGDDSTTTGDSDTTTSKVPVCGDGVIDPKEECDLGPDNDDAGACTSECLAAMCGDGHLQVGQGEACDEGVENSNTGTCTLTCQLPKCGDRYVQPGEACDDGTNDGSYGGCTPECELADRCGDGEPQEPYEECDKGLDNGSEDGLCTIACRWSGNLVFVSSEQVTGALGGLVGADAKCDAWAKAAGLVQLEGQGFMAWLSDAQDSPATRFTHSTKRYMLVDGTEIAKNWEELADGDLAEAIALTEYGLPPGTNTQVWTATTVTGKLKDKDKTCLGWHSAGKDGFGGLGSALSVTTPWTDGGALSCKLGARIYCMAQ
ncbi:MAG: hypothetical protein R3B09_09560 [Nannocystaceae bacterium]